jgi:carboxypeptidase family protein
MAMAVAVVLAASLQARTLRAQAAPARPEVVQGRVTDDSGRVKRDVAVIVTRLSDRQSSITATDSTGRYRVAWPDGTGDYIVSARLPGYTAPNKRVTRNGADSVLGADIVLTRAVQTLAPVVTNAQRPQPQRDATRDPDAGASEFGTFAQNAARRLATDLAGNLNAIAAMAPGVMAVNGGISVFGLGAAQNSTTLNGMAFASADIPRDAAVRVRVTTGSYDPSVGWFSGARTQVDLVPGQLFTSRNTQFSLDAPAAQFTDPVSASLGQRFSNYTGSMGGNGQLVDDRWAYNYGLQGSRKTSDFSSLLDAGPALLQTVGVAGDSVARLLQLLQSARIPTSVAGASLGQIDDNVSFIGRIDHLPFDWATMQPGKTTWGVTGYAKWARTTGLALGPTGVPAHSGASRQILGSLQGEWSTYIRRDNLLDLRSSISTAYGTSDPALRLPDGRVLVQSTFDDGTGSVANLQFGGNSSLGSVNRVYTWENIADLQLYPPGQVAHKVRLTADVRFDRSRQEVANNSLGSFTFNSLADLAANRPSSFSRTLTAPPRDGAAWNAFGAVGDVWRVSPSLLLKYGVRAEANVFGLLPAYNPAVESAFGLRTDHAPNSIGLSPRLGLVYSVPGPNGRPKGSLRMGVGEFRNLLDPSLLGAAAVATGLPNGTAQLSCFGDAVPAPDWNAYSANSTAIPSRCANGAAPAFVDAAPAVRVFDPSFSPARSWRGSLAWASSAFHMNYGLELTASHNINQRGSRELNFSGVPRFTAGDESRLVFAAPSSVVPATGVVAPTDARTNPAFGRVTEGVSDLTSESRQVTFSIQPYLGQLVGRFIGDLNIAYTLSSVRDELRGFDLSTFGDPSAREWARGALDARHQFVVQGVIRPHAGWFLFFYGHVQSGTPFTPMVRSDVNGDGLANDRAFVFDPARTADASLGGAMRTLLATAPVGARNCLASQLGRAAGRASCQGPWSATFNTSLRIAGAQVLHNDRIDITLNFANPLGGLDQLLHGNNGLHGWGTQPAPDPVLLDVKGFDPVARRFTYAVNPRFGNSSPAASTVRAPFRVTLDVNVDVAPAQTEQQIDRWLRPGRRGITGTRVTAPDLMRRFQRTVTDPFAEVLQEADSLLLTPQQTVALQAADVRYRAHIDSAWTQLSEYLASQPDVYDVGSAFRRADAATDEAWEYTRLTVKEVMPTILTPDQIVILPQTTRFLYNSRDRVHLRIFAR